MRILIDECLPIKLKILLPEYEVSTVSEELWKGKKNGELLTVASLKFDILLTIDQNISYQQNLIKHNIAIIALKAKSNSISDLEPLIPFIKKITKIIEPGKIYRIGF